MTPSTKFCITLNNATPEKLNLRGSMEIKMLLEIGRYNRAWITTCILICTIHVYEFRKLLVSLCRAQYVAHVVFKSQYLIFKSTGEAYFMNHDRIVFIILLNCQANSYFSFQCENISSSVIVSISH
jgi:hypothetical protein